MKRMRTNTKFNNKKMEKQQLFFIKESSKNKIKKKLKLEKILKKMMYQII